ncbi:hypothetical protein ABZU94_08715 [Streptomyces mirabilis]|uniref:hypothetical protein n=1 Tax=Streptomyces sp. NPDC005388 TaxID=3156717 RepID=UPI0033A9119D
MASPRFRYQFGEYVGQAELLAGWLRRHLPGRLGRERARAHLAAEADDLVPRQVGLVRADIQQRLTESTRKLERAIARRYDAVYRRLRVALMEAEQPAADPAPQRSDSDRERRLRQVLAELTALDREAPATRTVTES